ncbi:hypothetical protein K3495_g1491 [Podosphaera aphanis]|nr:hypothetical protein K3495_g1491 [Podosphaera aphanis]
MNSLHLLSGRVSAPQTPGPSRRNSYRYTSSSAIKRDSREATLNEKTLDDNLSSSSKNVEEFMSSDLLPEKLDSAKSTSGKPRWLVLPKRVCSALLDSIRWVISTLAVPGVYLITSLYDEKGNFSLFSKINRLSTALYGGSRPTSTAQALRLSSSDNERSTLAKQIKEESSLEDRKVVREAQKPSCASMEISSEPGSDQEAPPTASSTGQYARKNSTSNTDEVTPARRSIRIQLHDEDTFPHRKPRTSLPSTKNVDTDSTKNNEEFSSKLKSPSPPASSLLMTRYPRVPAPPRPLVPSHQPSYSKESDRRYTQKTLILDLDETLIHSMAKGGRMSTGHMVEVKLNTIIGAGRNATPGPQHPILYWVNKRPHCDDFLRLVCKWYNLVIFTASVQEYADPVIDLLEQERSFFSGRYYRQHCTFRNGAFIKDLSLVEPDLSKVMILDNSPLSYMLNQDNAIPIEGWINDPTDNNLLHLIPLLESLQYVTDVRAFLALRGGEDGKHT